MAEDTEHTTAVQRALDLFVFAPAGFVLTALEDLPKMAEKGRERIEGQVRNARVVGQFAVTFGKQDLTRRLKGLTGGPPAARRTGPRTQAAGEHAGTASAPAGDEEAVQPPHPPVNGSGPAGARTAVVREPFLAVEASPALNRAIPDYDTLSASQVVRRLDGLGPDELEVVRTHESQSRRRRTILHRVDQLLNPDASVIGDDAGGPAV